ncbi:ROK family protein [Paludicola sp. MB14-C6]|uniref:ROK family protein n=1 Tax=Paludihabitans sp. MB14-C6 TaxID=3070656 RepID=UPI0027DDC57F|nr:ROK family protein [Paludicola sp. MB14-C6]WMJ23243.1 ROK family protein [Paludicola sp. MB14-C6]
MKVYGIEVNIKNVPVLDSTFVPLSAFNKEFLKTAKKPLSIAVERSNGLISVYDTFIHGTEEMKDADNYYVDRMVKFLLWAKGGFKVYICGDEAVYNYVAKTYSKDGARAFDFDFMERVYEKPFEVVCIADAAKRPAANEKAKAIGKHLDGCRIGFDAGGSDRKVSAVIDGECVYSEEVVWHPKVTEDPDYHFNGILESFKTAASKMPRVDAIGVSSAGIYIDNRTMVASLFLKVPRDQFDAKVKDIYIRAAKEIGDVPIEVVNDGDVTALAGAIGIGEGEVLGIAMGTSEAVGYVDKDDNITGWLNELAFAPIDAQPDAMEDEWSGDIGCGVKYFSQDGVIKLAKPAGIELDENATPAEKLKVVQELMKNDDPRAIKVFDSIGVYLGHALGYYANFYDVKHILMLGRVMSGKGGDIILNRANEILADEYSHVNAKAETPDEKTRRVGQSVAAASLPEIVK